MTCVPFIISICIWWLILIINIHKLQHTHTQPMAYVFHSPKTRNQIWTLAIALHDIEHDKRNSNKRKKKKRTIYLICVNESSISETTPDHLQIFADRSINFQKKKMLWWWYDSMRSSNHFLRQFFNQIPSLDNWISTGMDVHPATFH